MKIIIKLITLSLFVLSPLAIAADHPQKEENFRSVYGEDKWIKPWLQSCDSISEIANQHIIPLMSMKTMVGNKVARGLSDAQECVLVEWQEFQEEVNKLASDGLYTIVAPVYLNFGPSDKLKVSGNFVREEYKNDLKSSWKIKDFSRLPEKFRDTKKYVEPQAISHRAGHLKEKILPILTSMVHWHSYELFDKNIHQPATSTYILSEQVLVQICKQKSLELSFEIEGLQAEYRLIDQQITRLSNTSSVDQKIVTKFTLQSLEIERKLSAACAQHNLANSTLDLLILLTSLSKTFSKAFCETQHIRAHNFLDGKTTQ